VYNIIVEGDNGMKLYLETTMFNYYFDTDRDGHADTVRLFEEIREGKHEAYTSLYAVEELEDAQEPKRSKMIALIDEHNITVLPITEESNKLANLYVSENVVPAKYRLDGAHIGIACIHELDCVLSYNFKHINRVKTKLLTGHINKGKGYGTVVICTAKEVLEDEQHTEE
jgi:hypothetical protein